MLDDMILNLQSGDENEKRTAILKPIVFWEPNAEGVIHIPYQIKEDECKLAWLCFLS